MLYLIKFIYSTFLLPPGIFIIFLAWVSVKLFLKKQRIIAIVLLGITLLFYLNTTHFWSDLIIHPLESRYKPTEHVSGDVIVILGGGATLDTPNLHGQGHLSGDAANRLLTGLQLYHQLHVPIIFSGGQVFKTTGNEAMVAKMILLDLGIPPNMIITENRSLNTSENASYTKIILNKFHYQQPILVTSAFHMPRSVKQFQKAGVEVIPYPTDYFLNVAPRFELSKLIPSAEALNIVSIAVKEYLGLLAVKWY